jgi:hypothetical protein
MRRGIGSTFITVQLYRTVMATSYAYRFSGTQFIGDTTGNLHCERQTGAISVTT